MSLPRRERLPERPQDTRIRTSVHEHGVTRPCDKECVSLPHRECPHCYSLGSPHVFPYEKICGEERYQDESDQSSRYLEHGPMLHWCQPLIHPYVCLPSIPHRHLPSRSLRGFPRSLRRLAVESFKWTPILSRSYDDGSRLSSMACVCMSTTSASLRERRVVTLLPHLLAPPQKNMGAVRTSSPILKKLPVLAALAGLLCTGTGRSTRSTPLSSATTSSVSWQACPSSSYSISGSTPLWLTMCLLKRRVISTHSLLILIGLSLRSVFLRRAQ